MTSRDPFRAFFAVPLDPEAARALEEATRGEVAAAGEAGWRPTPAERIHITLKFLGDAPVRLVPALGAALREAAAAVAPFPIEFGGGWLRLPGLGDPRVLAVPVSDPTRSLPRLAASLEARAEALGFPREGRPFLSHATVARRKGGPVRGRVKPAGSVHPPASRKVRTTMAGAASVSVAMAPVVLARIVVNRIVLMRSTLGPDGPTYEVVEEAVLDGRPQEAVAMKR